MFVDEIYGVGVFVGPAPVAAENGFTSAALAPCENRVELAVFFLVTARDRYTDIRLYFASGSGRI